MAAEPAPAAPAVRTKTHGFVDSFWSPDYAGGLGVLFGKLQQGVTENLQVLTIATLRAEAEETYSEKLGEIAPSIDRMRGGFARDDGASTRKAYEGVRSEMIEATKNHKKIADNIRELVVSPFGRWCDAHAQRVQNSQDELQSKIKEHDRQAARVRKLRTAYFNKCRLVEDQQEEDKLAFQDPDKELGSPKPAQVVNAPPPKIVIEEEEKIEPVKLGDHTYGPDELKTFLKTILASVPHSEFRVPILGTYQNVSLGSDIVDYIQKHTRSTTVAQAEQAGQDLVDNGFLRLVGSVGSTFANSSKLRYQWRTKAWTSAGVPEPKKPVGRASTVASLDSLPDSPLVNSVTETLQTWNPLNNPYPNETPSERLKREAKDADDTYKKAVQKLDLFRCNLESAMMDHLKFLERCETDRLRAIKSVILDFSGAISNSIPSFQSQVDHMMLYQETIQPLGDLRYLLENYKTGPFLPKVVPYENYYGIVDDQTFGVDLDARAKADKKRVPIVVTNILTYLDNHYPDLEGDEARRSIWLVDVPLAASHHLRNAINNGKPVPREVLDRYEVPIVASVLKLYLLELPDSLVSSQVYEIIKTIYNTTMDVPAKGNDEPVDSAPRIKALQSTLGNIRLQNIATLDALMTHFTRLIDLTSADEAYVQLLAQNLAPCVLRPKTENSLTMEERHPYRLIRDLFDHKEVIFGELKRQSSLSATSSISNRQRVVSNADESQRRQAMEARARAINQERQRAKSPAAMNRHKRDKSSDGSVGRFPVVASPRQSDTGRSISISNKRTSLDVPGTQSLINAVTNATSDQPPTSTGPTDSAVHLDELRMSTNGHATPDISAMPGSFGGSGPHIPPPSLTDEYHDASVPPPISSTSSGPTLAPAPTLISSAATTATGSHQREPSVGSLKRQAGNSVTVGRRHVSGASISGGEGGLLRSKGSLGSGRGSVLEQAHHERSFSSGVHSAATGGSSGASEGVQLTDRAMDG